MYCLTPTWSLEMYCLTPTWSLEMYCPGCKISICSICSLTSLAPKIRGKTQLLKHKKDNKINSRKDTVYNWYKEYKGYIYAKDTIDII